MQSRYNPFGCLFNVLIYLLIYILCVAANLHKFCELLPLVDRKYLIKLTPDTHDLGVSGVNNNHLKFMFYRFDHETEFTILILH